MWIGRLCCRHSPGLRKCANDVMLDALLSHGVDLGKTDSNGNTPLHLAVKAALGIDEEDATWVSEAEAGVDLVENAQRLDAILSRLPASSLAEAQQSHNDNGYLPIHIAIAACSEHVCSVLLKHSANANAATLKKTSWDVQMPGNFVGKCFNRVYDQTPLHLAVSMAQDGASVNKAFVRFLIKHGADLNAVDYRGRTPLQMAVMYSLYEIVEFFSSTGKSSKSAGQNGTVIHEALIRKDTQMVKLLLANGAHFDARAQHGYCKGWTPLCLAAREGAVDATKLLVSARANVHATSANGKSALEIANTNSKRKDCQAVLEVLQLEVVASVLEIAFRRPASAGP